MANFCLRGHRRVGDLPALWLFLGTSAAGLYEQRDRTDQLGEPTLHARHRFVPDSCVLASLCAHGGGDVLLDSGVLVL